MLRPGRSFLNSINAMFRQKALRHRSLSAAVLWTVILLSGCSSPGSHLKITESDIKTVLYEVEKATVARDIDGVIRHLAPFAVITLSLQTPDGLKGTQISRDQYRAELEKAYAQTVQYEYRRENTIIKIRDDGKEATVETDIREHIVLRDREMRTITREKAVLEIIDGKLLVTVLDGFVRPDH